MLVMLMLMLMLMLILAPITKSVSSALPRDKCYIIVRSSFLGMTHACMRDLCYWPDCALPPLPHSSWHLLSANFIRFEFAGLNFLL